MPRRPEQAPIATRRAKLLELVETLELVEIGDSVLERAAQPMPTELGTLHAIHLASALLWRAAMRLELTMATHDAALATAARAHGLRVVGIDAGEGMVCESAPVPYTRRRRRPALLPREPRQAR